jgi:uncharacterized RDD family membrane protein YckC
MTTMPPEPPDPTGGMPAPPPPPPGYGAPPPAGYGGPGYGGMPAAGAWAGPPLASWGVRLLAWLIDGIIIGVAYGIVSVISKPLALLVWIGGFVYLAYMQGTTGATIGKGVMKIKVLREADGQVIGFGMALLRYLLHFVLDGICLIGYLFPLWDAKKQTFADKILSTVVVQSA